MRNCCRYIFLLFLMSLAHICVAQEELITEDTVLQTTEPPPMEEIIVESSWKQLLPVEVRQLPKERVAEIKSDDAYWYANTEPEKKKTENTPPPKQNKRLAHESWFQNLLWVIILVSFIGVVIWYLASSNISLFRKESKKILEQDGEEELTDDIFAINYEKEIQKAVSGANYRLAVRLWYLKTLKEMADKNIIDYRFGKTNNDYVMSLYGGRYYRDFFRITRNFEYTWYGQFNLSAEAYQMMQADFQNFKNSLA